MSTSIQAPATLGETIKSVIAWRRHLHANPELSFNEEETARFVEETLKAHLPGHTRPGA